MPRFVPPHKQDTIQDLLYPTHGIRQQLIKQGITPRNHQKDNKHFIKELQQKVHDAKLTKLQQERQRKNSLKPKTHTHVHSRVQETLTRPQTAPQQRVERKLAPKNFFAGKPGHGAAVPWHEAPTLTLTNQPPTPRHIKPPVPPRPGTPAAAKPELPESPRTDFVKRNTLAAGATPRKMSVPVASMQRQLFQRGPSHGKLPSYLLDRKIEQARLAAEREEARLPEGVPPGHRLLSEDERIRVLKTVRESKVAVDKELEKFKFVIDTPGQKVRYTQLLRELEKLESAERAFSRKMVVVAAEDASSTHNS